MKKIYLFALSAALLSGGSAFAQNAQQVLTKARLSALQKSGKVAGMVKASRLTARQFPASAGANGQLSVAKTQVYDDIVSSQPEGTLHAADLRSGFSTLSVWGNIMAANYSNSIGTYVETDDAIFLKNPFNGFLTNTWLRIDKNADGTYVAHLPQPIYEQDGQTFYATHVKLSTSESNGSTYVADTTAAGSDAYFTYKDGVLAMADSVYDASGFPSAAIGLTDADGAWYGYLDGAQRVTPNTSHKTVLPAAAKKATYAMSNTTYSAYDIGQGFVETRDTAHAIVDVAFDGDTIYVNNPATKDSSSWIKGVIKDGKATFEPQYIGADTIDNIHLWFEPATYTVELDSSYYAYYGEVDKVRSYSLADKLELAYDAATKSLQAPDSTSFIVNGSPSKVYYLATYDEVGFEPWKEVAATPADPVITAVNETYNTQGYAAVTFTLPQFDTNGKPLNTDKAYYNLYTSDDPETPYALTEDEGYKYFNYSDSVNIPYSYTDGMDIAAYGAKHYWYIYFDTNDIDSVGVQMFYNGAGELRHSNLVWYSLVEQHDAAGINALEGNESGVSSVAYFDLSGRRVAAPKQAGLYIKEVTYADGTKKGTKVLKK